MKLLKGIVATGTGTTGTVSASLTLDSWDAVGELHSIYLDYGTVTSVTNVTIVTGIGTIVTIPDNATDRWVFPRRVVHTIGGTAYASTSGLAMYPMVPGTLRVSVSSSTPSVDALTAYLFIKEQ